MKKVNLILLLLITSLISCTSSRYLLSDTGKDKTFLIDYINEFVKSKQLTQRPMIVIDGKEYKYDIELKKGKLPISKDDIARIDLVKMEKAKKIYSGGILLITTKANKKKESK